MTLPALINRFNALPANLKGASALMLAAVGFTCMTLLIKLTGAHLHVTQILLVRQVVMIGIVAPAIFRDFPGSLRSERVGLQFVRLFFAMIAMLMGFTAVIHLPLADATAIGFAKSFFVTIFAVFILKEVVGIRRWMAVGVGFLGVLFMVQPGTDGFSIYALYSLCGSAAAGVVMVVIRLLTRTEKPVTIMSYHALGIGTAMLVPGIYFWQWPTQAEWIMLVVMGFVTYFSQMTNIHAYKWGEASVMASLDYIRLLYATVAGYLVFGNLPGTYTWIGAAVIIIASIYTIRREAKLKRNITRAPDAKGY
ncbi:MAG: DMT family transporter [Rhizobiaceae bacterium]